MTTNSIYISNSGSDQNPGTLQFPYATIAKAISVLEDSTTLYLERGSTFYGEVIDLSGKNNIKVLPYGNEGLDVYVSGFKPVTGWVNEGSNVWSHQDNALPDEVTNVLINGLRSVCGRVANRTSTAGGFGTLTDTGRTEADGYFNDAEIVYWPYDWSRGIARITDYTNKVVLFNQDYYYYNAKAGITYWIQNHRNCLSVQNTWAYDKTTKTIYIYSTAQPTDVSVSYGTNAINVIGSKFIEISDLILNGSCQCGVYMNNCSRVKIDNLEFNNSGIYSMCFMTVNGLKVTNCKGYNQNNDFMYAYRCTNLVIEDNKGLYCGVDQGSQRYLREISDGGTSGLTLYACRNIILRFNEIGYTGYSAIGINYCNTFLEYGNYVHHFNLNKYDGGGMYITLSGRHWSAASNRYPVSWGRVAKNILTDGNSAHNSYGIYPDNNCQDIEIAHNFSAGSKYNFHLHDVGLINVHDNIGVTENSSDANYYLSLTSAWDLNNKVEDNTFVSRLPACPAVWIGASTLPQVIKNNKYFSPKGKSVDNVTGKLFRIGNNYYSFDEWIADESRVIYGRDDGEVEITPSIFDTGLLPLTDYVIYFVNPSKINIEVSSSEFPYDDYVDLEGVAITNPVTILPHSVGVFIRRPVPEFSYAEVNAVDPTLVDIYSTINLNPAIVPATSAFTLPGKTITNVAIAANKVTLTVSVAYAGGDDLSISYLKPVTNPLTSLYCTKTVDSFIDSLAQFTLTVTSKGDGSKAAWARLASSVDIVMTLDGNGYFVDSYTGGNPVQTKTIVGGNVWRDFYVMCSSGVSNWKFSNIKKLTQWVSWTTITYAANSPILGGDISKLYAVNYLIIPGNQTIIGDLSKFTALTQLQVGAGCTGNLDKLSLLQVLTGCGGCTLTTTKRMKNLNHLSPAMAFTSANVNQILSDSLLNKDEAKPYGTTRIISLSLNVLSQPPTGQGLIDKAALQIYRSPFNDATINVWSVTTN